MNKILITGGAGFIGSSLVDALMLSKKHHVIVFDNFSTGNRDNVKRWLEHPNFLLIDGDMLDVLHLKKVVRTCNTVCHLSANSIVALGETDTKIDYEENLVATYNLLEAMRESDYCKKIMFSSTSTVYGESGLTPISEKYSPMKPISLYGASNDNLFGGPNDDKLTGGTGADYFDCGLGKDIVLDFSFSEGDVRAINCEG